MSFIILSQLLGTAFTFQLKGNFILFTFPFLRALFYFLVSDDYVLDYSSNFLFLLALIEIRAMSTPTRTFRHALEETSLYVPAAALGYIYIAIIASARLLLYKSHLVFQSEKKRREKKAEFLCFCPLFLLFVVDFYL